MSELTGFVVQGRVERGRYSSDAMSARHPSSKPQCVGRKRSDESAFSSSRSSPSPLCAFLQAGLVLLLGHCRGVHWEMAVAANSATALPASTNGNPPKPNGPEPNSLRYALTSGLAGGIAGQSPRSPSSEEPALISASENYRLRSQNFRRSPRSSQDIIPNSVSRVFSLCGSVSPSFSPIQYSLHSSVAGTWLGVFRASKDIYAETGIRGLLQGHSATLLRIFPYAAIKFMAYEKFHHVSLRTSSFALLSLTHHTT